MNTLLTAPTHPVLAHYVNPYASQIASVISRRAAAHGIAVRVNSPVLSGPGQVLRPKAGTIAFARSGASRVVLRPSSQPPTLTPAQAAAAKGVSGILRNVGPFSVGQTGSGPITITPALPGALVGFTVNVPVGRPKR